MISPKRSVAALLIGVVAAAALLAMTPSAAQADTYKAISGAGSSWSSNAIAQWAVNVQQYGLKVNYASTGSSDGRNQFKNGTVDYAVSEIPYGIKDGGVVDSAPTVGYAYMPIVAGGTAFMYNLTSGGKQVTNLRLSGDVVTKIFTGKITSWNDKAIKKDNPGLDLPKRNIVPVVRSDGSGSTAQFSTWMSQEHPSDWNSYCAAAGRPTPCGVTSNYPTIPGKGFIAQPNSQGVSGYVAQKANVGTITYVEYSYALKTGFPVAKILNKSGYYVEPTASNVAVGLLGAKINQDKGSAQYLTQILTGVYNNPDHRAYPLSSYSYMIIPTEISSSRSFTKDKGKSLSTFANYFLCEGQQQAEVLGYSPLPINLVKAGLSQVKRIPGTVSKAIDVKNCNNPTFSKDGTNTLAKNAPQPSACDKIGVTQCTVGTGGAKAVSTPTSANASGGGSGTTKSTAGKAGSGSSSAGSSSSGSSSGSGSSGAGSDGTASGSGSGSASSAGAAGQGTLVSCDADSGVCSNVVALPVESDAGTGFGSKQWLMIGSVAALLALVFVPAAIGIAVAKKRGRR